jgi:glycyl-tRNA synthetase
MFTSQNSLKNIKKIMSAEPDINTSDNQEPPFQMKDLVALCKRRGFIFQASEIYEGLNGFWDFGPLGTELKNNLRDAWWNWLVKTPPIGPDGSPLQIVGLDSSIIQNPTTWEASGHLQGFTDPLVDCRETKKRYRADHLILITPHETTNTLFALSDDATHEEIIQKFKKCGLGKETKYDRVDFAQFVAEDNLPYIIGPDTKTRGTLTPPREFNLMFETRVGAAQDSDSVAYLRPETAQGIFLNYRNVVDTMRVRVPFGIAQIGKAFRNEVTPRNFIFRSREFEQMEMEFFCAPNEAEYWLDFWMSERRRFWRAIGIPDHLMRERKHEPDELAHYARDGAGTWDIEFAYPFKWPDFDELEGIAHRTDYDLKQHAAHSGTKMDYTDPDTGEKYVPHVIEPAAGLTRGVLALLCAAYTPDPDRPSGMYMDFHPAMAPVKAAILPLTARDHHAGPATDLYKQLRQDFTVELDIKQNIGKRYARQDEIGTPFCFTIDNQTLEDNTVTVRHRNTMEQERIAMDKAPGYLREQMRLLGQ